MTTYLWTDNPTESGVAICDTDILNDCLMNLKYPATITTATFGTIALTDNSINYINPTAATTFSLPVVSDTTKFHQILVMLKMTSLQTINLGTDIYFGGDAPDLSETGSYNLIYEYDNGLSAWVIGSLTKGAAA